MAVIRLPLNPRRDLGSQLTAALIGRRVDLTPVNSDEVHPYTALASCWRRVGTPATATLAALQELQASPGPAFEPGAVSSALKSLIYAATEALDLYQQDIPQRLAHARPKPEKKEVKAYQDGVKRLRDPIAVMCNRMKHNHREIVCGRIQSQIGGATTFVYRINAGVGGVQKADPQIHGAVGFASIERTLHQIVHALLRADYNAATLVGRLPDNHDKPIELKGPVNLGLADLLEYLGGRVPIVAFQEPGRFDGITVDGDDVLLSHLSAEKVREPTRRTMNVTIDEVANSVDVMR